MSEYHVQMMGRVAELTEDEVIAWLRNGNLNGLELAREGGEEGWRPLHELAVFREAVPHMGDSADAARRRVAKAFGWHLLIYAIATGWLLGASLPALVWGLFVVVHASRALPPTWMLVRKGKLLGPGRSAAALPGTSEATLPTPSAAALPASGAAPPAAVPVALSAAAALPAASGPDAMLEDVRSMLARRPDASSDAGARLDGVAESLRELRDRIARLSALLATEDRGALEERLDAARQALERAADPTDEPLRRREVEVLGESLAAHERAEQALERLALRERLAVQQLHQLRLDLARAEADDAGPEDLDERLEQIRRETEAAAEVDALVGRRA